MAANTPMNDSASEFNPFRDLTQTFEQFKLPGVDMSAFADARRQDVQALIAANRIIYEALQALARSQAEMLTQAMQGMQVPAQGVLASGAKKSDMAERTEAAQKVWQKMLVHTQTLAEMMQKAQGEAMSGLLERAQENMGAMKDLASAQ